MEALLEVEELVCGYDGHDVIRGVTFQVAEGDFLGIIGPNGAGKTTLFRALTRLLTPRRGDVRFRGRDLRHVAPKALAREVAVLPQSLDLAFSFTVEEFVLMGRFPHLAAFERVHATDHEVAERTMALCDVLSLRGRNVNELSGGEKQRAFIAQALAQEPRLLLLDEPTSHLDIGHQVQVMDILQGLNRDENLAVVMVLHDLNLASQYCEQLILMKDGSIFSSGSPRDVLTYQNIEQVYDTVVIVKENPLNARPHVFLIPRNQWTRPGEGSGEDAT